MVEDMKNPILQAARNAHRRIVSGQEQPMDMACVEARSHQKYGAPLHDSTPQIMRSHYDLPMARVMWAADATDGER